MTGPGLAMNVTYADVDVIGLGDVWFRDLAAGEEATSTHVAPLGRGFELAPQAGTGRVGLERGHLRLRIEDHDDRTELDVSFPTRSGDFHAVVSVTRPPGHESLTVVIPWSDRRYQCTTKDVSRPATGTIRWGSRTYHLPEPGRLDEAGYWGCLDFGRGRWPYRMTWNWGAGAGIVDGTRIGLQLGGKWTDGTGMTENALLVDGSLSKLSEELVWTYDRSDWLAPWRVRTPRSDRLDVTFTPIHDKVSRLQAGIAASSVDQCFGTWSGRIVPDDGTPITVSDVFGWAEEATWRW